MTNKNQPYDLSRVLVAILFISLLGLACLQIVHPFILSFAWAGMVSIACWPLMLKIQKKLWGKRFLAVIAMTILLILVFVTPLGLLINSILDNSPKIIGWASDPNHLTFPKLNWLSQLPIVGSSLTNVWDNMIADGGKTLLAKIQPYAVKTASWFLSQIINVGYFLLHSSLMVFFSALLFYHGESVSKTINNFAKRVSPTKGHYITQLATQAIRAVALGIVLTALCQALLGGISMGVSGIQFTTFLTILIFISCLAQLGPLPILVPCILWLFFWQENTLWGVFLIVMSCIIATMDTIMRPALIRKGADLPFLLILCGVIGGMLSFGMIGLFIGPVVLAVGYQLIGAWINPSDELTTTKIPDHPDNQ